MTLLRHRYLRWLVTVPSVSAVFFLLVTTLPLWIVGDLWHGPSDSY